MIKNSLLIHSTATYGAIRIQQTRETGNDQKPVQSLPGTILVLVILIVLHILLFKVGNMDL
jgi:hypothetical protein